MVKTFRIRFFGRMCPCIEIAERCEGDSVHVSIHGIDIPQHQRLDKSIIMGRILPKPPFNHPFKHQANFHIRKLQPVLFPSSCGIYLVTLYLQISAGQKQTPDSVLLVIQLIKNDLFVNLCFVSLVLQQVLHGHLYIRTSFPNQFTDKAVCTGIRPISSYLSLIQII